jgi:hypothetical protein
MQLEGEKEKEGVETCGAWSMPTPVFRWSSAVSDDARERLDNDAGDAEYVLIYKQNFLVVATQGANQHRKRGVELFQSILLILSVSMALIDAICRASHTINVISFMSARTHCTRRRAK